MSICDVCSVGQDATWDERKQLHVCRACLHAEGTTPGVAAPATDWKARFHRAQRLAISLDEQRRAAEAERDEARVIAQRMSRTPAGEWDDLLVRAEAAEAEVQRLREALAKIVAMEPIEPLEHQEFLGGAYLPHGPVNGCARAALGEDA